MPKSYRHIKEYEKERSELKEQGVTLYCPNLCGQ